MINWRAIAIIGISAAVIVWRTRDRRQLNSALEEVRSLRKAASAPSPSKVAPSAGRAVQPSVSRSSSSESPTVIERVVEGAAGDKLIIEGRAYGRGDLTPYGVLAVARGLCGAALGYDKRLVLLFPKVASEAAGGAGGSGSPEYEPAGRGSLPPLE